MTDHRDILARFTTALPALERWIDELLRSHAHEARSVQSFADDCLPMYFPRQWLARAKVVSVDVTPFPPFAEFLDPIVPELSAMGEMSAAGVTYKDTFFVARGQDCERLRFHEMVHVVQWATLGPSRFLLAYGLGLLGFGYEQSPLEEMAYTFERDFAAGRAIPDLVARIAEGSERIFSDAMRSQA